ncbi:hypothetical protein J4E91_010795 [Alternaria rosae]|nr:hypothetical protein J4E91_010795 [Alternaria rosae]
MRTGLLPHVKPLFDADPAAEEALKAWTEVLTNTAWYPSLQGSYQTAQTVATKAITARERVYGTDNNQTLISVSVLALVPRYQDKYEEAEKLDQRALEGREKELGEPETDFAAPQQPNLNGITTILEALREGNPADGEAATSAVQIKLRRRDPVTVGEDLNSILAALQHQRRI